ncbi:MAG: hypothetical protein ABL994_01970, partial [Verrucomicrobiales bacterium]
LQSTVLWYSTSGPDIDTSAYEIASESDNTALTAEAFAALLAGPEPVICVAERQNSARLCEEFALRELESGPDDRQVLLVRASSPY